MSPGTSTLLVALVAVSAVLVACASAVIVLLALRASRQVSGAQARLGRAASTIRRAAPLARHRIAEAGDRLDLLRAEWEAADRRAARATRSLTIIRGSLEGVTRGRLAAIIRAAGLVSRAAQLAFLWR